MFDRNEEKPLEEDEGKNRRKKLVLGGVALLTSASVLLGGLFHSPEALLAEEQPLEPLAIVQNDGNDPDGDGGDGDGAESASSEEEDSEAEAERGFRALLRQRILRLPYALRLIVLLPMWAVGWAVLSLSSALFSGLLGPFWGRMIGWLIALAALIGGFALAVKTVFPDLPLKKILNRRSLTGLLLGAMGLALLDLALPLFWEGYASISALIRALGLGALLGGVSLRFLRRERKRREKAAREKPAAAEEAPRPLSREDILAIADAARHA